MASFAEQLLAKVENILLGKLDKDAASYTVGGRSITKIPINELISLRDKLKKEVEKEVFEKSLSDSGKKPVKAVRFYFT